MTPTICPLTPSLSIAVPPEAEPRVGARSYGKLDKNERSCVIDRFRSPDHLKASLIPTTMTPPTTGDIDRSRGSMSRIPSMAFLLVFSSSSDHTFRTIGMSLPTRMVAVWSRCSHWFAAPGTSSRSHTSTIPSPQEGKTWFRSSRRAPSTIRSRPAETTA